MGNTALKEAPKPKGITVTYKEISNYEFQGAMDKLRTAAFKDGGRCAYLVKMMSKELKKHREFITTNYKKEILDLFAKRDENGNYDEYNVVPAEGKEKEMEEAIKAYELRTVTLDRPKFFAADIRDAHLTAQEQEAIDPILDDSAFAAMANKAPPKGPSLPR